ncbi:MAG: 50S ribosomal protein L23, partial [Candidatus Obscuribacterales bacterium]|nr:50S ribosomal protein L23 [Candidatus Obscuribacterales bacterium]
MNSRQSQVIVRPIINEKTVQLAAENSQYTFEVARDSNKIEIAEALKQILKELYPKGKFSVLRVNTSAIRDRFRRSKRHG